LHPTQSLDNSPPGPLLPLPPPPPRALLQHPTAGKCCNQHHHTHTHTHTRTHISLLLFPLLFLLFFLMHKQPLRRVGGGGYIHQCGVENEEGEEEEGGGGRGQGGATEI